MPPLEFPGRQGWKRQIFKEARMRRQWMVYAWPGLAQIDGRADVSGLLLAMLFTVGLNFL